MWVPFLRAFPGNEAHKLFSGGPKWGVLGGGQKVYVEKIMCFFRPLFQTPPPIHVRCRLPHASVPCKPQFSTPHKIALAPKVVPTEYHCLLMSHPNSEEDTRATTNVQNGLAFFFFIIFYSLFVSFN